nr:glycosyltransferase [uncultured Draconibacterium sp.]
MREKEENIVVLILNYNSWKSTIDYVHLLRKQTNVKLSVLIVDNCSPDRSFEQLSEYYTDSTDVEVIKSEHNGGYAYGNNFGLNYLIQKGTNRDTFVAISNNDITIENNLLLNKLTESYIRCKNVAFISPVMYIGGKVAPNFAWRIPDMKYDISTVVSSDRAKANTAIYYPLPLSKTKKFTKENDEDLFPAECIPGAFFMGRLSTFQNIAFFDERTFLFGEERIIAKKVKDAGLCNYIALNLSYDHQISTVIDKETDLVSRLTHILNSRIVYYKYHSNKNVLKVTFLKIFYSLYLTVARIRQKVKGYK